MAAASPSSVVGWPVVQQGVGRSICSVSYLPKDADSEVYAESEANARLIAATPELYEAAAKHLEWIEKEHAGPDYGGLTRDTHPDGERIWRRWWDEQLDLCADTERLCREGLAKARGEQ
jgi:hypothetical protein